MIKLHLPVMKALWLSPHTTWTIRSLVTGQGYKWPWDVTLLRPIWPQSLLPQTNTFPASDENRQIYSHNFLYRTIQHLWTIDDCSCTEHILTVQCDRVVSSASDSNDLFRRVDPAEWPEAVAEFSVFSVTARKQVSEFWKFWVS